MQVREPLDEWRAVIVHLRLLPGTGVTMAVGRDWDFQEPGRFVIRCRCVPRKRSGKGFGDAFVRPSERVVESTRQLEY